MKPEIIIKPTEPFGHCFKDGLLVIRMKPDEKTALMEALNPFAKKDAPK